MKLDSNGYAPSILTGWEEICFVSNSKGCDLVRHEIFFGTANRSISKKNGFWVYLTPYWHNMSNVSVHKNKALDIRLKCECQEQFEKSHTRKEFMDLIGKNYLGVFE